MSADNSVCPRCNARAQREYREAVENVMATYGKVPVQEFDTARAKLGDAPNIDATFREDYEFYGADEGTVTAVYSGACSECGLSVEFRHDEVFWTGDESATNGTEDTDGDR